MALIASGWRQVHLDSDKNQYVMFDDGIYRLNDKVEIDHSDGEDWVFVQVTWMTMMKSLMQSSAAS